MDDPQSDWKGDTTGQAQPKVVASGAIFIWWVTPCPKTKISLDFFSKTLTIKEFCNVIEREAQLTTPNQKQESQISLGYHLTPSRDIDDDHQLILQPDWTRGTTGHTQPN